MSQRVGIKFREILVVNVLLKLQNAAFAAFR